MLIDKNIECIIKNFNKIINNDKFNYAFNQKISFKINKNKTPNDFGFQKLCFPIPFLKKINNFKKNNSSNKNINNQKNIIKKIKLKDKKNSINLLVDDIIKDNSLEKKFLNEDLIFKKNIYNLDLSNLNDNFYLNHTSIYNNFISNYLNYGGKANNGSFQNDNNSNSNEIVVYQSEVMGYDKRKKFEEKLIVNSVFKKTDNLINYSSEKQNYDVWKMVSGFNMYMSFINYNRVFSN
ncbi:MAG: hypothetical protein ACOC3X_00125 [Nanoarchaeota archaeon]